MEARFCYTHTLSSTNPKHHGDIRFNPFWSAWFYKLTRNIHPFYRQLKALRAKWLEWTSCTKVTQIFDYLNSRCTGWAAMCPWSSPHKADLAVDREHYPLRPPPRPGTLPTIGRYITHRLTPWLPIFASNFHRRALRLLRWPADLYFDLHETSICAKSVFYTGMGWPSRKMLLLTF